MMRTGLLLFFVAASALASTAQNDLRVAQRAAELLNTADKWNRLDYGTCPANATTTSIYCSLRAASREVYGKDAGNGALKQAKAVIDFMAPRAYAYRLIDFNNDPSTTFADVQEFFRILQNRLARKVMPPPPAPIPDESDIKPPVTAADVTIVRRAREILDSPAKWNRADTRICPPLAKTYSLYCALEMATQEVTGQFQHRGAAMQQSRFVIDDIAPHAKTYEHRLMDYNNDPSTSFEDVQKFFRLLEQRVEAQKGR